MADTTHAVVRTDLLDGTDVRAALVSIKYLGDDGETATEIDNGNFVKVGALVDDEREVFVGTTPSSSDALTDVVLIATPEVMYDERLRNLEDFVNEADSICRGYRLRSGNIFSVTADALDGDAAVGSTVALGDSTMLAVAGTGTTIGTIIEEEVTSRRTFYAILVA